MIDATGDFCGMASLIGLLSVLVLVLTAGVSGGIFDKIRNVLIPGGGSPKSSASVKNGPGETGVREGSLSPVIIRKLASLMFTYLMTLTVISDGYMVVVPGDGGSMLEALLDKPSVRHRICPSKKDWSHVWVDLGILIPTLVDCWVDNLKYCQTFVQSLTIS